MVKPNDNRENGRETEAPKPAGNKWATLAGLRFFLAFVVVSQHAVNFRMSPPWVSGFKEFGAFAAVAAFLVISGYSIAHSITREPDGFYGRRVDRVYPTFFACFLIACLPYAIWGNAYSLGGQPAPTSVWQFIGDAFLLNGFFVKALPTIGVVWTLSIECACYLLAPLFRRTPTPILLALMAASAAVYWLHDKLGVGFLNPLQHGAAFAFLLWLWLLGFVYYRHQQEAWAKAGLLLFGALMLTHWDQAGNKYCLFTWALTASILIWQPAPAGRLAKTLTYLGELSFPLYLVHATILALLLGGNQDRPAWLFMVLSLLAAPVIYHLVDAPYRRRAIRLRKPSNPGPVSPVSVKQAPLPFSAWPNLEELETVRPPAILAGVTQISRTDA